MTATHAPQLDLATYNQLRAIARNRLNAQAAKHTLQPTALANEVWIKLKQQFADGINTPGFFKLVADAMRQVLIDHARSKNRLKRGGGMQRVGLSGVEVAHPLEEELDSDALLALDASLTELATLDPQAADVVKHRFFAGLSVEDTARAMGISERTVKRDWQFARAWLAEKLSSSGPLSPVPGGEG